MSKLRVSAYSISLDGFGAGLNQSLENPLGVGGMRVHDWIFPTQMFGGKEAGVDNDFAQAAMQGLGAWIMGRNMFGPDRGDWDLNWKGWWDDDPPYHCDVYVLSHHKREPLEMLGGTTFHFVTDGIHAALERAKTSAQGKDIRIGGGASTVRQYLQAGLIDEMHIAVSPVLLGQGEAPFAGLDLTAQGFTVAAFKPGERASHYVLRK